MLAARDAAEDSLLAARSDSNLASSCTPTERVTLPKLVRCAEIAWSAKSRSIALGGAGSAVDTSVKRRPEDLEDSVHRMLLAWKKDRESHPLPARHWPRMIQDVPAGDLRAHRRLPQIAASALTGDRRFHFLGAGPFLQRLTPNSGQGMFLSPEGMREARHALSGPRNSDSLLDALASFPGVRFDVVFGPPLECTDKSFVSVHEIGSVDHLIRGHLPAYFVTRRGVVSGRLVSIRQDLLAPEFPNWPTIVFATPRPPSDEILAVILPLDPLALDSLEVHRDRGFWTADIDRDGVPDFAGIVATFAGITGDTLSDIRWYVNLDGVWRLIDTAVHFDRS